MAEAQQHTSTLPWYFLIFIPSLTPVPNLTIGPLESIRPLTRVSVPTAPSPAVSAALVRFKDRPEAIVVGRTPKVFWGSPKKQQVAHHYSIHQAQDSTPSIFAEFVAGSPTARRINMCPWPGAYSYCGNIPRGDENDEKWRRRREAVPCMEIAHCKERGKIPGRLLFFSRNSTNCHLPLPNQHRWLWCVLPHSRDPDDLGSPLPSCAVSPSMQKVKKSTCKAKINAKLTGAEVVPTCRSTAGGMTS